MPSQCSARMGTKKEKHQGSERLRKNNYKDHSLLGFDCTAECGLLFFVALAHDKLDLKLLDMKYEREGVGQRQTSMSMTHFLAP